MTPLARACVLAAALFMLGGPASARLQHTGIVLSYSAFPLALLLLQLALERRSPMLALAFSVTAVGVALGVLSFSVYVVVVNWVDYRDILDPRGKKVRARSLRREN